MKRNLGLTLALPMLTLVIGVVIGNSVARPAAIETDVIPALSLKQNSEMAQSFCVRSSVFADLSKSEGRVQKRLETYNVWTAPISDRGVICTVEGRLLIKHHYSESATVTTEQVRTTFIVAITGESEVVTEEFAQELARSPVVAGMASNVGNDGTVVPKVKLRK
jgi:hypothetical protein